MTGKSILLIGASGGIGTQLAPMFAQDNLILHYHKHSPSTPGFSVAADVTDYGAVECMVKDVLDRFEHIDVLINASGISVDGFAHKFSPEAWRKVVEVNLFGSFNVIRAVLPSMRANHYGRIISLSSVVFQRPMMGTSAYSASKAALVGLTRTVASENATMGITCNLIALGYFDAGLLYQIPPEAREEIREAIPQKRFGRIDELSRTIQYAIDTEYLTGQVISLNGGLYMS
jgi:NAD(P)-dependent dehydrogenase (short-subunit alcohol dehydrogenase family)